MQLEHDHQRSLGEQLGFAAGSVIGRDHTRGRRNNQDAVAIEIADERWVLVVADGCGSGRGSEVGARLGSAFVASHFAERGFSAGIDAFEPALLGYLSQVAVAFGSGAKRARGIADHLLFTFLAVVVEPSRTRVLGVGDGVVIHDSTRSVLTSGLENTPSYAAYDLLSPEDLVGVGSTPWARPVLHADVPTASLSVIGVATDGASVLAESANDPLAMICESARRSRNPYVVQRRLVALAERGPRMSDDTTIALVWRTSCT